MENVIATAAASQLASGGEAGSDENKATAVVTSTLVSEAAAPVAANTPSIKREPAAVQAQQNIGTNIGTGMSGLNLSVVKKDKKN